MQREPIQLKCVRFGRRRIDATMTYSSAVSACAKGGQWERALALVEEFHSRQGKACPSIIFMPSPELPTPWLDGPLHGHLCEQSS